MDRAKTILFKASEGAAGCRKMARALVGPIGPLPPVFKSRHRLVARKRVSTPFPPIRPDSLEALKCSASVPLGSQWDHLTPLGLR